MLPLIPIACVAGFIASALGLTWYDSLSKDEKEKADKLAADFAWNIYQKSVKNLTYDQSASVAALVRDQLGV